MSEFDDDISRVGLEIQASSLFAYSRQIVFARGYRIVDGGVIGLLDLDRADDTARRARHLYVLIRAQIYYCFNFCSSSLKAG